MLELSKQIKKKYKFPDFNALLTNKYYFLHFNFEHTLVKEGGRSVHKGTPFGKIKYNENKNYFVRIQP